MAQAAVRPLPVVRIGSAAAPPTDPVRWNCALTKTFDVARAQFPPRTAEQALVSRYLDCEVKLLQEETEVIPSVRIGGFLKSLDESLREAIIDDIRNLTWDGKEEPPVYELIQLNSRLRQDFLVDGIRFFQWKGTKLALRVQPAWYGLDVTTYAKRDERGVAHQLLDEVLTRAAGLKLLQGEAFALSGQFLTRSEESWDDLFLEPANEKAIRRVVTLINEKGATLENRGMLLVGPPGTGKTLSGRLMMNAAKGTFIWVSARDFHRAGAFGGLAYAFSLAKEYAPSILFIEDVDNWLDGYSVDLLKTEMDGIAQSTGVVTVLTTNYPELLPKALIDRPGRFHDVLKFDLPDPVARGKMLQRWLPSLPATDRKTAVDATDGYSGAHVRELARFATIIQEQEGLTVSAALTQALAKLAEQRALITAVQTHGSRYRMAENLQVKMVRRTIPARTEYRAYSVLKIKEIDSTNRNGGLTFSGIATTPEVDRVGDEIVTSGIQFENPVSLLLYHDTQKPIGQVTFTRATAEGLPFSAVIPDPTPFRSTNLRERVNEAIDSVIAKLVRAVSIGFRPLNEAVEVIRETGGFRFLETELLELSLVTIPANADATIATIKSFDRGRPAASGTGRWVVVVKPGPTGADRSRSPMFNIQERIKSFEASRQAKAARMTAIMEAAGDATLDPAQSEEYDSLDREVKSLDEHLVRLTQAETINKANARPALGTTANEASVSRGAHHTITVSKPLEPGIEFARYAMCLLSAKGFAPQALEIARTRFPDMPRIETVLKAAIAAGTTTDPTWAGSLVDYQNFTGDFIQFLRPATIIGRIDGLQKVPFNIRVIGQTSGGQGYWVGEGAPKPLTKFDFTPTELGFAKVANIAVLSDELVRFSSPSAETLVRNALAAAIIERMDKDFIDPAKAAVTKVSPASITNGITPVAHSGTDAAAVRVALAALIGQFVENDNPPDNAVFIMPSTTALALSLMVNAFGQPEFAGLTMKGGTLLGIPVVASQYASLGGSPVRNIVILANASDIYLADDGQVVIDASREASLQMLDNPTNSGAAGSPAAPVATTMVSLWQANLLGLRAERFVNWARRRPEAVAWLDNVAWAA